MNPMTSYRKGFLKGALLMLVMALLGGATFALGTVLSGNLTVQDTNKTVASGTANLTVHTTDAIGVDKGGSLGLGGQWYSVTPLFMNFAEVYGRKESAVDGFDDGYFGIAVHPRAGVMTEALHITSGGYVGLGLPSPPARLSVLSGGIFNGVGSPSSFPTKGTYIYNDGTIANYINYDPAGHYDPMRLDATTFEFRTGGGGVATTMTLNADHSTTFRGSLASVGGTIDALSPTADVVQNKLHMGCGTATNNAFDGICNLQAFSNPVSVYRPLRIDASTLAVRTDPVTLTGKTHLWVDSNGDTALNTEAPTAHFQVNNQFAAGTGTITSVGTAVTGLGTAFTTQLRAGDTIKVTSSSFGIDYRYVAAIAGDTALTLSAAFGADVAGAAYTYNTTVASIHDVGDLQLNFITTTKGACAADTDVGRWVSYSKSAGATISMCFCQKVASTYLWAAIGTGDCT